MYIFISYRKRRCTCPTYPSPPPLYSSSRREVVPKPPPSATTTTTRGRPQAAAGSVRPQALFAVGSVLLRLSHRSRCRGGPEDHLSDDDGVLSIARTAARERRPWRRGTAECCMVEERGVVSLALLSNPAKPPSDLAGSNHYESRHHRIQSSQDVAPSLRYQLLPHEMMLSSFTGWGRRRGY